MAETKIVCTIGPATSSERMISSLIRAGMDVARLNFSHGTLTEHALYIERVRRWSTRLHRPVAVLQDLQGIKIRIGAVEGGSVRLRKNQEVVLSPGGGLTTEKEIYISYPALTKDLKRGHRVLIDDGLIELRVISRVRGGLRARVTEGGVIQDRKGVNLPDSTITLSPFTEKDRRDLEFGLERGVDFVALSFVMGPEEIKWVKRWMKRRGFEVPVIAKIEKPEAVERIEAILDAADGIMVARGDLGVEVSPEKVPLIQKDLIHRANERAKLVITATQMLESMRTHLRPTRAEAADVANAVIDGTDALMLSAETSTGRYPVESLRMMKRIVENTEESFAGRQRPAFNMLMRGSERTSLAVVEAAVEAAGHVGARCIVAFTRSGFTALLASKARPGVPVIAFTPSKEVLRRMSLYWGVKPFVMKPLTDTDRMVEEVERALLKERLARRGEKIVIIASLPPGTGGKTNFMKIHRVGERRSS